MSPSVTDWITAAAAVIAALATAIYAYFTVRLWRSTHETAKSRQEMTWLAQESAASAREVAERDRAWLLHQAQKDKTSFDLWGVGWKMIRQMAWVGLGYCVFRIGYEVHKARAAHAGRREGDSRSRSRAAMRAAFRRRAATAFNGSNAGRRSLRTGWRRSA